ncbi:MAG: type II secretion system GspH family protein [Desulfobacteraceae bacterium]|nr:type II secretion system GspH family protein [Desulfobacteraceae bacterium]
MTRLTGIIKYLSGKRPFFFKERPGFTLIELIIVIMLIGFMGAIIAPLIGPALTGSHRPAENLDHATDLSAEMAKVVAYYRNNPPENTNEMHTGSDSFQSGIPNIVEEETVNITANELVMFEQDGDGYNETACDDQSSLDCVLKVRLESTANPGEILTYYFPYRRE